MAEHSAANILINKLGCVHKFYFQIDRTICQLCRRLSDVFIWDYVTTSDVVVKKGSGLFYVSGIGDTALASALHA